MSANGWIHWLFLEGKKRKCFAVSLQNVYSFGREIVCILEQARIKCGMSIAELTRRTGTAKKRLWYALNGQPEMRMDEFIKLCAFFNLGLGCFIDRATVERLRSSQTFRE